MAHSIFGSRFYGYRQAAWHGLGTVFEGHKTLTEAFTEAGLDYEFAKCPIKVLTPWGEVDSQENAGKVAIVRQPVADDPVARQVAVVSSDYGLMQNMEIARLLDPLSQEWGVETVGALGRGERIFATLRVGSEEIKGDEVQEFFLLNENKDGTGGINLTYTTVRVVCANTLRIALSQEDVVNIQHTTDVADKLGFEASVLGAMKKIRSSALETIRKLAETTITDKQAEEVFAAAFPMPKKPRAFRFHGATPDAVGEALFIAERNRAEGAEAGYKWQVSRVEEFRNGAKSLYIKLNDEFPQIARTAWGAVNAISELADHRTGRDADGKSKAMSATFGARSEEKDRALRFAVDLSLGKTDGAKVPARSRKKATV